MANVPFFDKRRIRGEVTDAGGMPKHYIGRISQVSSGYCFVKTDDLQMDAFIPAREFQGRDCSRVDYGVSVRFRFAFSMLGAAGIKAELAG